MKLGFFLGEAYRALRRNAAPSIAAVVTIAVTVLLVGVLVPVLDASGSKTEDCLLYTSPSPRDGLLSRMPSSA